MIENMSNALPSNSHHRDGRKMADLKNQVESGSSFNDDKNTLDNTQVTEGD